MRLSSCLPALVLCSLLAVPPTRPAIAADRCQELLEQEVVFSLAHDELVDYLDMNDMDVGVRVTACEIFVRRVEAFLDDYPARCDTQDNIKDLTRMRDNAQAIMQELQKR